MLVRNELFLARAVVLNLSQSVSLYLLKKPNWNIKTTNKKIPKIVLQSIGTVDK